MKKWIIGSVMVCMIISMTACGNVGAGSRNTGADSNAASLPHL